MRTFPLVVSLLAALSTQAQSVTSDFDKKIILTDSLNMPRHTSAMTLITLLPELLQRPGTYILSNYDVQIEGMSVSSAADVVLSELQIANVEKIEIVESPVASYLNNGQGGSINFVLRTTGEGGAPLWGTAGVTASSYVDVAPQFNIGYHKDKFMVRGFLLGELTNRTTTTRTETFSNAALSDRSKEENVGKFRTEMARAYLQYNVTEHDVLKLNVSESYTHEENKSTTDYLDSQAITQTKNTTDLHALLNYKRQAARHTLEVQAEYRHMPTKSDLTHPATYFYNNHVHSDNLSGKLEYKALLFNRITAGGAKQMSELIAGANFNGVLADETATFAQSYNYNSPKTRQTPHNNTYYIMPYLALTCQLGKLRLKAMGEFQRFTYMVDIENDSYTAVAGDFTGKLMAEWHFNEAHNLRFIVDRKLQRPGSNQLYPFVVYAPQSKEYVKGNPDLKPQAAHEAMVEYLGHLRLAHQHNLTAGAALSYNLVNDVISSYHTNGNNGAGGLGTSLIYQSFNNNGKNHIANANIMALYSHRAFSLSLVGNLYHKVTELGTGRDHHTYYNISLHPYFNLKDGWHGGARLVYYSRVGQNDGWLADQATASMTVGKAWKHLSVYLSEELSFLNGRHDIIKTGTTRKEKSSAIIGNVVGAGVRYSF